MRLVFFGTPEFAVPSLERLIVDGHELVGVVTQPPRPAGRGRALSRSPIGLLALARGLDLLEPARLRGFETELARLEPELSVVVAYGRILSPALLAAAPRGALNVHASLLPRWRGAAPIARAILAGDELTGVTTMQLDEGMDTGPLYESTELAIGPEENAFELGVRLAAAGAELLASTLAGLAAGQLTPRAQLGALATSAPPLAVEEGSIDWRAPAVEVARAVRAFNPWPTAWTLARGRRLKLFEARVSASAPAGEPGVVVAASRSGFLVACGSGTLEVSTAQLEGKPVRSARDLVNGRLVAPGDQLGA